MAPRTKDPNTCCEVSERNVYGYNETSQQWESIKVLSGVLQVQLLAPSYVRTQTGYSLQVQQLITKYTLGSQQQFSASSTGTTFCPTAVDVESGDVACIVVNTTATDPVIAIQWRFYQNTGGAGLQFDGPITNLPAGSHINAAQFYVSMNGTFNEPHIRPSHGWQSAKLGVRLQTGGTPQTIQMDFIRIYV